MKFCTQKKKNVELNALEKMFHKVVKLHDHWI